MRKTIWRNISLPTELVEEIEDKKPDYMSIAEFVRHAVRYYIDSLLRSSEPIELINPVESEGK